MDSKKNKKDYFPFDVYIDNENFKKFIIFGYKIINKELDKGEKLFLNISLNNYVNAKLKLKRLFITSSQLMKLLKNRNKLVKLSFSRTQINKTFLNVMYYTFSSDKLKILNNYFIKQSTKDRIKTLKKENTKKSKQLKIIEIIKIPKKEIDKKKKQLKKLKLQNQFVTLKKENGKKAKQLKKLKLQDQFETLKTENARKAKKLKSLKSKQETIIKNTLKKFNKPKKSIWDVIELPKPLVI